MQKIFTKPETRLTVVIGTKYSLGDLPPDVELIDSVESGVHPADQVKLLEKFCWQVNHLGMKIVLTTFSPYVMSHLNNLLQGSKDETIRKKQAQHLFNQSASSEGSSFMSPEHLEVYNFIDNQLVEIPYDSEDKNYDWETLSRVSVDVQQVYFQIYEEGVFLSNK